MKQEDEVKPLYIEDNPDKFRIPCCFRSEFEIRKKINQERSKRLFGDDEEVKPLYKDLYNSHDSKRARIE